MESWRICWRNGLQSQISSGTLATLKKMLDDGDSRLIQGATTNPPPLQCMLDMPCEKGCLNAVVGVIENGGFDVATVRDAEDAFVQLCFECDNRIGEPAGCRWFLNHYDSEPRATVFRELSAEIGRELERRLAVYAN